MTVAEEPGATAVRLAIIGLLMGVSVLASRLAGRLSLPVALLFLAVGMAAGSEGLGHIPFEDYGFAYRIGTASLVLILFDGGLNTSLSAVRRTVWPASVLATVGVALTCAIVAVGARLCGLGWGPAFLLGAVVSSTDAASVFAVLRGNNVALRRRVASTLELESGLNDPLAVLLTTVLTEVQLGQGLSWGRMLFEIVLQLVVGAAIGLGVGWGARRLFARVRLPVSGLWPVLTVALAFGAYGLATLCRGSGFLTVYLMAILLGNGPLPYKSALGRVHDALAWLGQVVMFLVLGLLSFPSRLWAVAGTGLLIALILACVARPLAVLVCLLPFRYRAREIAYVGWVGLRGAVPIILAIFPVLRHAPSGQLIFDVVFFIVVVSALVPGATVPWVTRRSRLEVSQPPPPRAVVEVTSTGQLRGAVLTFYVEKASAVADARIADLPFPSGAVVMLIVRGEEPVVPRGDTVLRAGDHVYVFCRPEDRGLVLLLFGRPDEE